jgi:uncharacterized protein (DUF3820 family)
MGSTKVACLPICRDITSWFAREGIPSGELGRLIELMDELDHNALWHLLDPLRKR